MQRSQGFEYGVKHILSPKSGRLSSIVSECCQISLSDSEFLLCLGAIYIQNERALIDLEIKEQTYLRVHTKPRRYQVDFDLKNDLLFESEDFLAVHKPSGSPCHASVDNRIENLHHFLEDSLNTKLYVTTRLDVPTEGVLVYAKTRNFLIEFNQMAQNQRLKKHYCAAICRPSPLDFLDYSKGLQLRHFLEASPKAPKLIKNEKTMDSDQLCLMNILSLKEHGQESLLEIELLTGRTHQIRAQLGFINSPIIGDRPYGSTVSFENEKIKLTATDLKFRRDDGRGFHFHSDPRWL